MAAALTNDTNRMYSCMFCEEPCPSQAKLSDHLMSCGNKTDQCPTCHQFIRRATFAYHYENNCAKLNEFDTEIKSTAKSNLKIQDQENILSPRSDRSTTSNKAKSEFKRCRYCYYQCLRDEYKAHKRNCLQNPDSITKKRPEKSLIFNGHEVDFFTSENVRSKENDSIPCEYCNQQISFTSWETHTKSCKEKEDRRLKERANKINEEPTIETSSCEYCKKNFLLFRLGTHERSCEQNPENIELLARIARNRTSNIATDPILPAGNSSTDATFRSSLRTDVHRPSRIDQPIDQLRNQTNDSPRTFVSIHAGSSSQTSAWPPQSHIEDNLHRNNPSSNGTDLALTNSFNNSSRDTLATLTNDSTTEVNHTLTSRPRPAASADRSSMRPFSGEDRSRTAATMGRSSMRPSNEGEQSMVTVRLTPAGVFHTVRSYSASRSSFDSRGSYRPSYEVNLDRPLEASISHLLPRDPDPTHQPVIHRRERSRIDTKPPWRN